MDTLDLASVSQFCPEFPLNAQIPGADENAEQRQQSSNIKRVMVVDDETLITDSLVDILQGEGYVAIGMSNGASAIQWAKVLEPDAIICDVAMPAMDGFEVAKQIRNLLPRCHIILLSGHGSVQTRVADMSVESTDFAFLAKPIRPEIILQLLRQL